MNKSTLIGLLVVLAVAIGAYYYPQSTSVGASAQGSTGQSASQYNVYGVNLAAAGANATSSSVYNGSGQDLYITAIKAGCETVGTSRTAYTGAGLAALTVSVATSSAAHPASNSNTNIVGGGAFTLATSTAQFAFSTSTALGGSSSIYNVWAAGSYMTFTVNATNTAVCTFGVDATHS